jgi:hypothetical protein
LEVFAAPAGESLLPGPATSPAPADGEVGVSTSAMLGWVAGAASDSQDVYFGSSALLGLGDFQGNQPGTGFDPGLLAPGTTYYWRVDQVNSDGTLPGCTWSFTTAPEPAELIFADDFE